MQFVTPTDWFDAIDKIGDKTPIGSLLASDEWSDVPLALRERAFFSSQIESIRFLQRMRDGVTDFLSSARETLPDGQTALKVGSRQDFVKQFSELAISEGLGPLDAHDAGTIADIRSEGRLNLIFDTMTQSAHDYSYWKQGQDQDVLDAYPAQQFIRERDVKTPRPIHQQNEGVIHLKSDLKFWLAMNDPSIGGFGVPWGPWGFRSGMGTDDVDRATAEQLGMMKPGQKMKPVEKDFNEHLEASTQGLDNDMVAKLKDAFGDQVEFDKANDTVSWKARAPEPAAPIAPAVAPAPAPAAPSLGDTLDQILGNIGLDADQTATPGGMVDLRASLQEDDPMDAQKVIKFIHGAQPAGALTDDKIFNVTQEFVNFFPKQKLAHLPPLQISVKAGSDLGSYNGRGILQLNKDLLRFDDVRMRRTLFHELMHWIHREGDQAYRDAIADHFADRTAGERIVKLTPYSSRGKKDRWYDLYAGTIYPFETTPGGLEVPTRYIEWLTLTPEQMAARWNDPVFRETMKIVLGGLF